MGFWGDLGKGYEQFATLGLAGGDKPTDPYQDEVNKAMGTLKQQEEQGRGDIKGYSQQALGYGAPYREAGTEALGAYEGSLGLSGGQGQQSAVDRFRAGPGYQFALKQGLTGVQHGMAATGMTGSGAEAKELQRTGQGLADQEYGQYQQRLAGLAGQGQQAAGEAGQIAYGTGGALANLGTGYGQNIASLQTALGSAEQQKQQAAAQQKSQMWGTIGKIGGAALMAA